MIDKYKDTFDMFLGFRKNLKHINYLDWNYLIKVVQKIETLHLRDHGKFVVHISSNSCTIEGTNLYLYLEQKTKVPVYYTNYTLNDKISSVYECVYEFIMWYSKQ